MLVSQTGSMPFNSPHKTISIDEQPVADHSHQWGQKIERNKQLLLMMHKLQQVEESVWAKFFRFEKTSMFMGFEKKFTFKQVLRVRLDDIIYLLLLTAICIVFALLPSETTANSMVGSILLKAYRYFLAFLVLFSTLWLISTNCYRHFVFALICILFPLLTLLTYYRIIPFDQIDPSTTIFSYIHILSLWVVYGALYIVYPIKQFVRNKIGSLYSYLFALSTLTLFLIWPTYSLIEEMAVNMQVSFNFITQNKALIITFLVIVVFTFHLFTHQTFFEGSLLQTKRILLIDFSRAELTQALTDIDNDIRRQNSIQNRNKEPTTTFLYRNYGMYTRFMSFLMFAFTIAIEIYVFLYLADNLTYIYRSIAVMLFCIIFPVYGCIMNLLPISRQATLFFFSLISLVPAALSPLYCSTCASATLFTFYEYVFMATALPYTTIFWCVVRSLSRRRPFLKLNILVTLYIFVHIPLTLFMINNLGMISSDSSMMSIFNMVLLGIVAFIGSIGLIGFILWLCLSVKQLPKQQKSSFEPVDYNYFEQGSPAYVPYVKKQSFSLSWLSSLDIRNLSQLFNCINFIAAQLVTMYIFNQLNTTYANIALTSDSTRYIVYAQFYITFAYFTYAYSYIVYKHNENQNIIMIVVLMLVGLFGVIFSYVNQQGIYMSFRIAGGFSIAIAGVGIGLHVVKNNNKDIMNFLSGVLVILLWIFLIHPYAIALPIATIYISSSIFGQFIYACILGSTLLLVVLVSIMSIVFNILMNKFEEEKKIKFMVEDVQTFLKEEGIETEDEVLHILHESYENRDEKYVFFMKRGFPIRVFKDPKDQQSMFKTVVYNHEILNRGESMQKIPQDEKPEDYCWLCLTFCCGVDESELQDRANKVSNENMIDEDQMQQLVPEQFFRQVFIKAVRKTETAQRKYVDLSKLYSSKSIILRHLTTTNKHLGEQFPILKTRKNKKLANQIWHLIYSFLANEDDPPAKIIFNDFLIFCSIIDIPSLSKSDINTLFLDFSTQSWKGNTAIDINDFSILIEELTVLKYPNAGIDDESKYAFLLDAVYPSLCNYAQFQDVMHQRRVKTTKQNSLVNSSGIAPGSEFSQNFSSIRSGAHLDGFAKKAINGNNLYSLPEQQLEHSPFITSFEKHKDIKSKISLKKGKLNQKKAESQFNKLIQPAKQQIIQRKEKKQQKVEKSKSCKVIIYEKYQSCKTCCKKIEEEQVVIKRKHVKPWQYLAVEAIRIMEHKDQEWKQQKKQKQYEFRLILNNILIAVFKLADLYTFMEITIMNPQVGWQSAKSFSILTFEYRIQLYASFGVVLVCSVLGIKGITYIFQDRLGLTETRVPAVFPHPMFFFTFFYKLLILSLFNTIIMTLFSTFMCDWTTSSSTFTMILNSTQTPLVCFSAEHNIYVICSLICILLYYPLSAYTMPNFQFAEKRLDLKYKPSYLIIYFQVNFILAAGKVLLSQMVDKTQGIQTIQILFQSLNIFSIALLGLMVIVLKPCLISWFNVIEFLVIWIGLVWNVLGLVLYLTSQWLICIIVGGGVSAISIILSIIFIRKKFFSAARVEDQLRANDMEDLELAWKYKKELNYQMARFQKGKVMKDLQKEDQTDQGQQKQNMGNKNSHQPLRIGQNEEVKTNYASNKVIRPPIQLMEPEQN